MTSGPTEPPPAPVARGAALLMARYLASTVFMSVWPSARKRQLRQVAGNRQAAARATGDVLAYRQKTRYSLPFSDEWYVFNGGPDRGTSHSWDLVAQRYAYDFVVVGEGLRRWRDGTRGQAHRDYLCYGLPILAPADGVVVVVEDGVRDAPGPGTGWLDPFVAHIAGNQVVIEHAPEEFSLLAHLAAGSVEVETGDHVTRGQRVAACGNSGNTTEPHLHFQVQDRADFYAAAGLPVAFDGVSVDGDRPADDRRLVRGSRVRRAQNGPR